MCGGIHETDEARNLGSREDGIGKYMRGKVVSHLQQAIPDSVEATIS